MRAGALTGAQFRRIRRSLGLTQLELARILGYRHKIRISEFERSANPVPVPLHIQVAVLALQAKDGAAPEAWGAVRDWGRAAPDRR